jgi:hypothetical protein
MASSSAPTRHAHELLTLLDWKRRVSALYREIRTMASPTDAWNAWCDARDELFRAHVQSPLPEDARASFTGLSYFAYDASFRVLADVVAVEPRVVAIGASKGRPIMFERFGEARFELMGEPRSLDVYWLDAYGSGLFLPFADATSGWDTYPAGRYLLDTVKGADLGTDGDRLVLDFNFAYNPSCAYDSRWACPLAPPANRLELAVRAGERIARQ